VTMQYVLAGLIAVAMVVAFVAIFWPEAAEGVAEKIPGMPESNFYARAIVNFETLFFDEGSIKQVFIKKSLIKPVYFSWIWEPRPFQVKLESIQDGIVIDTWEGNFEVPAWSHSVEVETGWVRLGLEGSGKYIIRASFYRDGDFINSDEVTRTI